MVKAKQKSFREQSLQDIIEEETFFGSIRHVAVVLKQM